jgi:glycine/D-amino acid oxidase-like deaminating enzyme
LLTLSRTGVAFEELTYAELELRYKQISFGGIARGILEPHSGVLMARRAVRAIVEEARRKGVVYLHDSVLPPKGEGKFGSIVTVNSGPIAAGTFLFACGPWLPKVFPVLLGELIRVTRQEIFFLGAPSGTTHFLPIDMPVFIDFGHLVYCIPDIDGRGFKFAIDAHGIDFDPDLGDRVASREGQTFAREYLAMRVPALANAPVTETRVCQYENTSNGDFLIDRHPAFENVWLIGGGSGHGFKHGPAVAEYVVEVISNKRKSEPRFTLASKRNVHQREVY